MDGKAYKAYVKEKEEAKKTYDAAVASGQAAAHVAVSARDSNSFTVALNVEPQNKVSFNLTYEELLTRRLGLYQHVITLNPGQVVRDLEVRVHVKENQKIEKLRVPEFSSGNKIDGDEQACADSAEPQSCTSGKDSSRKKHKISRNRIKCFEPLHMQRTTGLLSPRSRTTRWRWCSGRARMTRGRSWPGWRRRRRRRGAATLPPRLAARSSWTPWSRRPTAALSARRPIRQRASTVSSACSTMWRVRATAARWW